MKLFCPGPVMISENVKKSLVSSEIGHRSRAFEELFLNLKQRVLKLSCASSNYDTVFISASGSAINESVIASVFTKNDKLLVLSNGLFGERIAELLETYSINFDIYNQSYGKHFDYEKIIKKLSNNNYSYVFLTHHETSCGMLNNIHEIGMICKKFNVKLFVDAVSSFGAEKIDLCKDNIAIMTSVSGKCVGSTPGASFVVMKKTIFENMCDNVSFKYLSLKKYYEFSKKKNQTPNTPSVAVFNALNTAFDECISTFKGTLYLQLSNYLRDELEKLGYKFLIDRNLMSSTVTSIIASKDLYDYLYDLGFVTYLGNSEFYNCEFIQITVMGNITKNDCVNLVSALKNIAAI